MSRPKLLDLFCCAGGAGTGYYRAGFDVYGVDIDPQPNYPFPFHPEGATQVLLALLRGQEVAFSRSGVSESLSLEDFAAIHASPPCQGYSTITPDKSLHPKLIAPIRDLLEFTEKPFVIENVEGAKDELIDPMRLCGSSFGLRVRRHRYFESNVWLSSLPCDHGAQGTPVGVYGDHWDAKEVLRPDGSRRGAKATSLADAQDAMGIDWTSWHELAEAIPPAFTEFIGTQLIEALEEAA